VSSCYIRVVELAQLRPLETDLRGRSWLRWPTCISVGPAAGVTFGWRCRSWRVVAFLPLTGEACWTLAGDGRSERRRPVADAKLGVRRIKARGGKVSGQRRLEGRGIMDGSSPGSIGTLAGSIIDGISAMEVL
jgi:hypothetical protein